MAKSAHQKLRLLYLRDYLRQNTDENHPASIAKLIEYIESNDINVERKTIYDDIAQLQLYGEDIVLSKGKNGGYFCASTEFDVPEIKLLVDTVQSSKFVSENQSLKLIKKLEHLTNIYEASQLQRQVVVQNRVKSMRESIFNNVDYISFAINNNKTIKFKYFAYNIHKKQEYKHDGAFYEVSPYALICDDENYYLLAFDSEAQIMKHFRVDKMDKISVTEKSRDGAEIFKEIDMSQYNKKVFGMYSGNEENVKMRFNNNLVGVVIDRFGKDISIIPEDDNHFTINVKAEISPQFFAWVFGFGSECEIISPASVREELKQKLKETANLYK